MTKKSRTYRLSDLTMRRVVDLRQWLPADSDTHVIEEAIAITHTQLKEQQIVEMEAQKMATAKVETIRGNKTPNGQAMIMRVKVGDKQIGPDVEYWPWSDKSCEQADQIISEIANNNDLELEEW